MDSIINRCLTTMTDYAQLFFSIVMIILKKMYGFTNFVDNTLCCMNALVLYKPLCGYCRRGVYCMMMNDL